MSDVVPYILAQIAGGLVALELHKRIRLWIQWSDYFEYWNNNSNRIESNRIE
jgi:glycerol uptake facilitator-like aquaporin